MKLNIGFTETGVRRCLEVAQPSKTGSALLVLMNSANLVGRHPKNRDNYLELGSSSHQHGPIVILDGVTVGECLIQSRRGICLLLVSRGFQHFESGIAADVRADPPRSCAMPLDKSTFDADHRAGASIIASP